MFKVGDRVEWCLDGRFDLYHESDDNVYHDFGEVVAIVKDGFDVRWDSGGISVPYEYTVRKAPPKEPTYTKVQIKAFLETLSEDRYSWFDSERKIAEQVFYWFESFVNKPTQDEEELKALELLKSRGYRVEK